MKFTKMHGAGNDYIYINGFEETIKDRNAFAIKVSDRHFGIGSDGLIVVDPSDVADCKMDMYNADGSQGKMCGNGVRCVAKFVYDNGIVNKEDIAKREAEYMAEMNKKQEAEEELIKQYVADNNIKVKPTESGMKSGAL